MRKVYYIRINGNIVKVRGTLEDVLKLVELLGEGTVEIL